MVRPPVLGERVNEKGTIAMVVREGSGSSSWEEARMTLSEGRPLSGSRARNDSEEEETLQAPSAGSLIQ